MVSMNRKQKVLMIYIAGVIMLLAFLFYSVLWSARIQQYITLPSSCSIYASQIRNSTAVYVTTLTSFFNINQINATEIKLCEENPNNNFNKGP